MINEPYWNTYYKGRETNSAPEIPSQFAAFIAGEFNQTGTGIIEFGCGNGRDTVFFASHGVSTIGIDSSSTAIANCKKKAHSNATFLCLDVEDEDESIIEEIGKVAKIDTSIVYARFFLHALEEAVQAKFMKLAHTICGKNGHLALEFRTNRDSGLAKATAGHFRRYIDPMAFLHQAEYFGFQIKYFVEGFGYAKFKIDDAHVARFILSRNE